MENQAVVLIVLAAVVVLAAKWLRGVARARRQSAAWPARPLDQTLPPLNLSRLPAERAAARPAVLPRGDLSARYLIDYVDVNGEVTRRQIDVLSVDANGVAVYIRAYCHLRGDRRTFRAERVMAARVVATGEDVGPPGAFFFGMIPPGRRPDAGFDALMRRARPGLEVLVWVARGDDIVESEEIDVMLEFIARRGASGGGQTGDGGWNEARAAAEIGKLKPTLTGCRLALARMSRGGRVYPLIREYAQVLAEMSGEGGQRRFSQLFSSI